MRELGLLRTIRQQSFHISLGSQGENKLIFILLKSLLIFSFLQYPDLYSSIIAQPSEAELQFTFPKT